MTSTEPWRPVISKGLVLPTGTFFRYRMNPGEEKTYARVAFMATEPHPAWPFLPGSASGKAFNVVSSRRNSWHCSDRAHDVAVDLAVSVTFHPVSVVSYDLVNAGVFFVPASDAGRMFVDAEHWIYTAHGLGVELSFRESLIEGHVPCEKYVAVLGFGDGTELIWKGGKGSR